MSFPAPPIPQFPDDQVAITENLLRYEDCTQDGRLIPIAIPPSLGGLWQSVVRHHPGARNAVAAGIVPILTRLTLSSEDQPIRVDRPVEGRAGFVLAHDREGDEITRLYMNVWSEVRGTSGRLGPRPSEGSRVLAGRLFAEHVFTRLFAPPDQRKITRLDVAGYPAIPELHYPAPAPQTAQEAPDGARWLDELASDATEIVFGLDQTDANQHVNSLVYIRTFLDAAQRRLHARGHALNVRSRAVDIAYRKPCFAGDRVRTQLRLFALDGQVGAAGYIEGPDGKPRCYARVVFGP